MVLNNTTVLLLGACKVFILYIGLLEKTTLREQQAQLNRVYEAQDIPDSEFITVKSERRTHRLNVQDILYVEGMGNYVTYHMKEGDKEVVYSSLKEAQSTLPEYFIRLHRSYLINKKAIDSFNNDEVFIAQATIPRGKDIQDAELVI